MKKKTFCLNPESGLFYSDAVIHGDTAYICGQMSLDLATDAHLHGTIEEETAKMLENFELVLKGIGCSREDVLSTTVFMKSEDDFAGYNKVYGEFFGHDFPVRTTVTVKELYADLKVEMNAIVAVPKAED